MRGGAGDDSPRPRGASRSPRCRPNTRCGRATPRMGCIPTCRELGSGSFRTRRSAAGSCPAASPRPTTSTTTISAARSALHRREPRRQPQARRQSRRSPRRRDHAGSARAGMGDGAGRRHRADPGTKRRTYLEENAGAADVKLPKRTSPDRSRAATAVAGERYDESGDGGRRRLKASSAATRRRRVSGGRTVVAVDMGFERLRETAERHVGGTSVPGLVVLAAGATRCTSTLWEASRWGSAGGARNPERRGQGCCLCCTRRRKF